MKLIIEIPLDGNDLEETDFEVFLQEANFVGDASYRGPATIGVVVGRPLSEEESHISRQFELGAEHFTVRIEK